MDSLKEEIFEKNSLRFEGFGLFLTKEILEITGISIKESGTYLKGVKFEIKIPENFFRRVE